MWHPSPERGCSLIYFFLTQFCSLACNDIFNMLSSPLSLKRNERLHLKNRHSRSKPINDFHLRRSSLSTQRKLHWRNVRPRHSSNSVSSRKRGTKTPVRKIYDCPEHELYYTISKEEGETVHANENDEKENERKSKSNPKIFCRLLSLSGIPPRGTALLIQPLQQIRNGRRIICIPMSETSGQYSVLKLRLKTSGHTPGDLD